jgi:hypothetical protein
MLAFTYNHWIINNICVFTLIDPEAWVFSSVWFLKKDTRLRRHLWWAFCRHLRTEWHVCGTICLATPGSNCIHFNSCLVDFVRQPREHVRKKGLCWPDWVRIVTRYRSFLECERQSLPVCFSRSRDLVYPLLLVLSPSYSKPRALQSEPARSRAPPAAMPAGGGGGEVRRCFFLA